MSKLPKYRYQTVSNILTYWQQGDPVARGGIISGGFNGVSYNRLHTTPGGAKYGPNDIKALMAAAKSKGGLLAKNVASVLRDMDSDDYKIKWAIIWQIPKNQEWLVTILGYRSE